jgi:hypothetical protein
LNTNLTSHLKGAYLGDLLAQPSVLIDTIATLPSLPPLPARALAGERIVLTGMGASLHAIHPLRLRLVRAGRTAFVVETAELIQAQSALLDARTLIIAVSQSGRSAETVQLLDLVGRSASRPFVIGVTNGADSPLAFRADAKLVLRAGPDRSTPSPAKPTSPRWPPSSGWVARSAARPPGPSSRSRSRPRPPCRPTTPTGRGRSRTSPASSPTSGIFS